jgi:hypothetical protein
VFRRCSDGEGGGSIGGVKPDCTAASRAAMSARPYASTSCSASDSSASVSSFSEASEAVSDRGGVSSLDPDAGTAASSELIGPVVKTLGSEYLPCSMAASPTICARTGSPGHDANMVPSPTNAGCTCVFTFLFGIIGIKVSLPRCR